MTDHTNPPSSPLVWRPHKSRWARFVLIGLAVYLLSYSLAMLAFASLRLYRQIGLRSVAYDFFLYRVIVMSLLPFLFNLMAGAYLGSLFGRQSLLGLYARHTARSVSGVRLRKILIALLVLLWWGLFNLPQLVQGVPDGGGGRSWPPPFWFPPVARELLFFFMMGNFGFFGGLCGGIVLGEIRQAREMQSAEQG